MACIYLLLIGIENRPRLTLNAEIGEDTIPCAIWAPIVFRTLFCALVWPVQHLVVEQEWAQRVLGVLTHRALGGQLHLDHISSPSSFPVVPACPSSAAVDHGLRAE